MPYTDDPNDLLMSVMNHVLLMYLVNVIFKSYRNLIHIYFSQAVVLSSFHPSPWLYFSTMESAHNNN